MMTTPKSEVLEGGEELDGFLLLLGEALHLVIRIKD
jgi:hypothetical protein